MTKADVTDTNKDKANDTKNRDFILNENVNETSIKDIIMGIIDINKYDLEQGAIKSDYIRKPIKVIVNTFGGAVYDGFALAAVIDSSETPVYTYLYGKAMSMGVIVFASGHRRFAHSLGTFMYHQLSFGVHDSIEGVEQRVEQARALMEAYDEYILSVSNLPKRKMDEAKSHKRDWYIPAREALKYGLVDEILVSKRSK